MFVVIPFPHLRIQELLLEGGDVNKLRTRHQNMIIFFPLVRTSDLKASVYILVLSFQREFLPLSFLRHSLI